MELGAFSISLAVADINKSQAFYTTLGFNVVGGDASQGWLILRSGKTTIGLFQGMFDKNLLTFNPGWDAEANPLASFTDVREIQASLVEQGIELVDKVDPASSGPGSLMIQDPDGNPILIDQHV